MASLPKPCKKYRCQSVGVYSNGYCPDHQEVAKSIPTTGWHRKVYNEDQHFYNSRVWRKLRLRVIQMNPICKHCSINPSKEVDHIIPLRLGGEPLSEDNLQALCTRCHAIKSARKIK